MNALDAALWTRLAQGTVLTGLLAGGTAGSAIYQTLAPENQDPPYVTYQRQAGAPHYTLRKLGFEDVLYTVKGVTQGPSAKAGGAVATAIDLVLTDQPLTITGYDHLYLRRVTDIDYLEVVAGVRVHHRGGVYRLLAAPA